MNKPTPSTLTYRSPIRNRFILAAKLICLLFCLVRACPVESRAADEAGFTRIFNGENLEGWDGDPRYWSVMDHVIRGQGTRKDFSKVNTFLIWRGGTTKDFVVKAKFKLYYGNSGLQYRSTQVSDEHSKWRVFGYQSEVADPPDINAFLFDEGPRWILAHDGEFVVIDKNGRKNVMGQVCDAVKLNEEEFCKVSQWNDLTVVARGNHFMHFVNGYQIIEAIDSDPKRVLEGILALQLHGSGPGIVEFKDLYIKTLHEKYGEAACLLNGHNLEGWAFYPASVKDTWSVKDYGAPPETEAMRKVFNRKPDEVNMLNSALVNQGGSKGYIRTATDYTDYILRFQFRGIAGGGGSALLRLAGEDKTEPQSIKIDLSPGHIGEVSSLGNFSMKTGRKPATASKGNLVNTNPLDGWTQCEISLSGDKLEVRMNDVLLNTAKGCSETPGKIGFLSDGGQMEYRNVLLIPLNK